MPTQPCAPSHVINREHFFKTVRASLFGGKMSVAQVMGLNTLLDAWERDYDADDDRWLAYALATSFHETATTMQPIGEKGGNAYYTRLYDVKGQDPARARKYGNTTPGDGIKYRGRGYVQLTWKVNYAKAGKAVGVDLVNNPDRAMEPAIAARVLFAGMKEGWFTTKKQADYFNAKTDWVGARYIINGKDRAALIASYAQSFYAAISYVKK